MARALHFSTHPANRPRPRLASSSFSRARTQQQRRAMAEHAHDGRAAWTPCAAATATTPAGRGKSGRASPASAPSSICSLSLSLSLSVSLSLSLSHHVAAAGYTAVRHCHRHASSSAAHRCSPFSHPRDSEATPSSALASRIACACSTTEVSTQQQGKPHQSCESSLESSAPVASSPLPSSFLLFARISFALPPRTTFAPPLALSWPEIAGRRRPTPPCCHTPWGARFGAPQTTPRAPISASHLGEHDGADPETGDLTEW